jgi:Na+/H+ antiporter NhaA
MTLPYAIGLLCVGIIFTIGLFVLLAAFEEMNEKEKNDRE